MPQPRKHATQADRQRAYRARVRERLRQAEITAENPHVIQAPLRVLGCDGRTLLEVAEGSNGPVLRLLGTAGKSLVILEAHEDGGGVYTLAPTGEAGAQLYAERKSGKLSIADSHGREVVELPH